MANGILLPMLPWPRRGYESISWMKRSSIMVQRLKSHVRKDGAEPVLHLDHMALDGRSIATYEYVCTDTTP